MAKHATIMEGQLDETPGTERLMAALRAAFGAMATPILATAAAGAAFVPARSASASDPIRALRYE